MSYSIIVLPRLMSNTYFCYICFAFGGLIKRIIIIVIVSMLSGVFVLNRNMKAKTVAFNCVCGNGTSIVVHAHGKSYGLFEVERRRKEVDRWGGGGLEFVCVVDVP